MMDCKIICHSNSSHLSQVFTGFELLHSAGEIALSQECRNRAFFDAAKPQHLRDARHAHSRVILNHDINLYYDCHDGYEIDETAAGEVDYYFKRSYAESTIPDTLKPKVFPLGLNYMVFNVTAGRFEKERLSEFQPQSRTADPPLFQPTVENMQAVPNGRAEAEVLFMTRAWDPFDHPERTREKIEERIWINETRAKCIQLLRKEFGPRFMGGLQHTDYAVRNFRDALLPSDQSSAQVNYIRLLSLYPICVATTGLHRSIGWKLGEYVAFSRAIVTERLYSEVPGDFQSGLNYLEFGAPEFCLNAVHRLLSDPDLRLRMMQANHEYYLAYLKPDVMIRRTLQLALTHQAAG